MTEQLMDDLTNEEHEALLLMSEHGIAAPLSPAAKAVLDAATQYEINPECYSREIAAAALRVAADQVVPDIGYEADCLDEPVESELQCIRNRFLAIADELENING
jgi:hypothetical protein